ncbi:hypothetical protein [Sphingomonas sp.]|uniref:hypothetical protein n=1 Tax=Sphingomonas sp. TaxID=28214 RepID=UPI002FD9CB52
MERYGLPSLSTVATMRRRGLPFIRISKQHLFDPADVEKFIASQKETQCRDEAAGRTSSTYRSGGATTSSGAKLASQSGKARALEIAERLKRLSPTTSRTADARAKTEAGRSTHLN